MDDRSLNSPLTCRICMQCCDQSVNSNVTADALIVEKK